MEDTNLNDKSNNMGIVVAIAALIIIVIGMINIKSDNDAKNMKNNNMTTSVSSVEDKDASKDKFVKIEVHNLDGTKKDYGVTTQKDILSDIVKDVDNLSVGGDTTATGLFVKTVNGVYADYIANQTYWAFYINDQYCQTGIDSQMVNDGDVIKIVHTSGGYEGQ